jgi:hypothetical protein
MAALEVMSRFAANPKWLIYLPPTMSPSETSQKDDYLEYPTEALDYYRRNGVESVVCEEKHMGSRAVVVICRNEETARARFGVEGVCLVRMPFFTLRGICIDSRDDGRVPRANSSIGTECAQSGNVPGNRAALTSNVAVARHPSCRLCAVIKQSANPHALSFQ